MQTIQIQARPQLVDIQKEFQSLEAQQVLQLFKEGAVLRVWRHFTPHQWWLEHQDGREYHWPIDAKQRRVGTPRAEMLVAIAKEVERDGTSESGKPGKQAWVFAAEMLASVEATWAYAHECVQDWSDNAGAFPGTLESLSPVGLAAFHTLRKSQLPMCPELKPVLLELNSLGLLQVHPEGFATVKLAKKGVVIPKAESLKIERIKQAA